MKKEPSTIDKNCPDVSQKIWFGETSTEPLEQLIVTMTEVRGQNVTFNNIAEVKGHNDTIKSMTEMRGQCDTIEVTEVMGQYDTTYTMTGQESK